MKKFIYLFLLISFFLFIIYSKNTVDAATESNVAGYQVCSPTVGNIIDPYGDGSYYNPDVRAEVINAFEDFKFNYSGSLPYGDNLKSPLFSNSYIGLFYGSSSNPDNRYYDFWFKSYGDYISNNSFILRQNPNNPSQNVIQGGYTGMVNVRYYFSRAPAFRYTVSYSGQRVPSQTTLGVTYGVPPAEDSGSYLRATNSNELGTTSQGCIFEMGSPIIHSDYDGDLPPLFNPNWTPPELPIEPDCSGWDVSCWFGSFIDTIQTAYQTLVEALIDIFIYLYIPRQSYINDLFTGYYESFSETFAGLIWPIDIYQDIWSKSDECPPISQPTSGCAPVMSWGLMDGFLGYNPPGGKVLTFNFENDLPSNLGNAVQNISRAVMLLFIITLSYNTLRHLLSQNEEE